MKNTGARKVFERIVAVCVALTNTSDATNQRMLARRFEVSEKTISRDFEFIRDRLMLPVEYNTHTRRWWITSPEAARKIEGIGQVFANLQ
ncbi:MAG: hypothetical protein AAB370_08315 [Verrucomicrobiota bacterium]